MNIDSLIAAFAPGTGTVEVEGNHDQGAKKSSAERGAKSGGAVSGRKVSPPYDVRRANHGNDRGASYLYEIYVALPGVRRAVERHRQKAGVGAGQTT